MLINICSEISGKSCAPLCSKYVVEAWTNMSRNNTAAKCSACTAGVGTAVDLHYDRYDFHDPQLASRHLILSFYNKCF
jgi:hypothetical protein